MTPFWRRSRHSSSADERLDSLETRAEHLEAALEGLQDALYRQSKHQDAQIAELQRRTEPGQVRRDLSEDARRRGL